MPLICIALIAMVSTAGAVELSTCDFNNVNGIAMADGDIFAVETNTGTGDQLYSGVWAHAYVPSGNPDTNSAESGRTVPAMTESRDFTGAGAGGNMYSLVNRYGLSTVIAKASKTGVLGAAEAFSEVSSQTEAHDAPTADQGAVSGYSQLTAYISHSGTGTANAFASGSSDYAAMMKSGIVQASGSVAGSVAIDAANNYGGAVTGAAFKASQSYASNSGSTQITGSESFEYLFLTSGRNALSAKSTIDGRVSGGTSGNGSVSVSGAPGRYARSASSSTGDLSATATTYKLGDDIRPDIITTKPAFTAFITQLDNKPAGSTGMTDPAAPGRLYNLFLGGRPEASAYLLSQSTAVYDPSASSHRSTSNVESFTSARVTRTLVDANEVYGASYINHGAVCASADTALAPIKGLLTLASAHISCINMGSGAHLINRLTGGLPASAADMTVMSEMTAGASGSVKVTGDANKSSTSDPWGANALVMVEGPLYSSSGTSQDATGSYLKAANIGGTVVHNEDTMIMSINDADIWSWVSGDDPKSHAESTFWDDPNFGSGPTVKLGQHPTTRSVDLVFLSIQP
ncbi:MAG TPA: hypothetical protein VN455_01220 [Methanotrichaceae archaeon]|nr:hypothetical protein [Methanotrichaceae archaeon]